MLCDQVSKCQLPIWLMYLSSGIHVMVAGLVRTGAPLTTNLSMRWPSINSPVMWLAAVQVYWPWSAELTLMTCRLPDSISLTRSAINHIVSFQYQTDQKSIVNRLNSRLIPLLMTGLLSLKNVRVAGGSDGGGGHGRTAVSPLKTSRT